MPRFARARITSHMADTLPHCAGSSRRRIGVCSWSLVPATPAELVERVGDCGVSFVQLALDPIRTGQWNLHETVHMLRSVNIGVLSGMMGFKGEDYSTLGTIRDTGGVRIDTHWDENLRAAHDNAAIARETGLSLVTFHAGFLPHPQGDPVRELMLDRLRGIIGAFALQGVRVAFETGQERADTLVDVLGEPGFEDVGINFDPANLVLYGMGDPVASLQRLKHRVVQIHIKDAIAANSPGTWGTEVPVGTGDVDWDAFLGLARSMDVDLVIEREAGNARVDDVRLARTLLEEHLKNR